MKRRMRDSWRLSDVAAAAASRRLQLPSTGMGFIPRSFRMCWDDVMNGWAIHHQGFLYIAAPDDDWATAA